MKVQNRKVVIEGRLLKTVRLEEEWYEDIGNPNTFLEALSNEGCKADIFTFWQRFPDSTATVSLKRMRSTFYAWRWRGSSESA